MMGRTYLWYAVEEAMFDGLSPRIHRLYLNRKRHVTAHELSLDVIEVDMTALVSTVPSSLDCAFWRKPKRWRHYLS